MQGCLGHSILALLCVKWKPLSGMVQKLVCLEAKAGIGQAPVVAGELVRSSGVLECILEMGTAGSPHGLMWV